MSLSLMALKVTLSLLMSSPAAAVSAATVTSESTEKPLDKFAHLRDWRGTSHVDQKRVHKRTHQLLIGIREETRSTVRAFTVWLSVCLSVCHCQDRLIPGHRLLCWFSFLSLWCCLRDCRHAWEVIHRRPTRGMSVFVRRTSRRHRQPCLAIIAAGRSKGHCRACVNCVRTVWVGRRYKTGVLSVIV